MTGARLELHHPQSAGVALKLNKPWEGGFSLYGSVLKDGNKYQMYYRDLPHTEHRGYYNNVRYTESQDRVPWTRPDLGKYELHDKLANHVILKKEPDSKYVQSKVEEWVCHNF